LDNELKNNIKTSYNSNSRLRDKSAIEKWKLNELDWFSSQFERTEGLKLLDVGAGSGQHSSYLQSRGFDVQCIDNSTEMVNLCRSRNIPASLMDFYNIEFPKESYDAVWSMNALLHVPKKSLPIVLENIRRVLKPSGLFYLGLYGGYNSEAIWEEDPYSPKRFFSFFAHEDIQRQLGMYFEIMEFKVVEMAGMTVDFQSMILRKTY
jgi:SAM-dependent methyltransferase